MTNYDALTMDELQRLSSSGDMSAVHALGRRVRIDEYQECIARIDESLEDLLKLPSSGLKISSLPDYCQRELKKIESNINRLKDLLRS